MSASSYRVVKAFLNPPNYWADRIEDIFGIKSLPKEKGGEVDPIILRQVYFILTAIGKNIVSDCNVPIFYYSKEMGPNLPKYPSHGYYYPADKTITLNVNIFYDPDYPEDFKDDSGFYLNRAEETLAHELGHSYDNNCGKGIDLSLRPDWLKLSGWSETYKQGLKRLIIREPGMPEVRGEWFFNPTQGLLDSMQREIRGMTGQTPMLTSY